MMTPGGPGEVPGGKEVTRLDEMIRA